MKSGQDIIDDVNACSPGRGEVAFWWLGQHSFIVKTGHIVLYMDPFLSPLSHRLVPPLLKAHEITNADIVCGSHDHADHIDRGAWPALAAASPKAVFVAPDLIRESLIQDLKIDARRVRGIDDGRSVAVSAARITGIAAAHEFLDQDSATGRFPYLGFVIKVNGCTFYHSGDCCIYEGLVTKLKRWKFDAVFLPINGRDAKRLAAHCIGNMTYQEAADLAGALQPRLVVPAHHDMFAMNLGDVKAFVDYVRIKYPDLRTTVGRYGERIRLPARS